MDYSSETHLDCLLASSSYPTHLRSVAAILYAQGIQVEEGLHRPSGSDELVPALMVSREDYPRASALADWLGPMLRVTAHWRPNHFKLPTYHVHIRSRPNNVRSHCGKSNGLKNAGTSGPIGWAGGRKGN
jgi:hypothetical protein